MKRLSKIVTYTDKYLCLTEIGDFDNALNGLQVENSGRVTRIGVAVDGSTRVLKEAARKGVDLLIVHHGLFWSGLQPVTLGFHRQLKVAFENDMAVYSAHLPLDVHPVVGNNALLAAALRVRSTRPFVECKGQPVGLTGTVSMSRAGLIRKLERVLHGPVKAFNFGPATTRALGIITGGAGGEIHRVVAAGVDTFITGEASHPTAVAAEELGVNLLLGGHYATETFGVKALAAHLSKKFSVPWEFIDCPTGM